MLSERRRDLLGILQQGRASSQQDIAHALRRKGHDVTQATVSRDLRAVGATKVRAGDGFVYRLPDELPWSQTGDLVTRTLRRTLDEFAIEITAAASIVVVHTAPGHASAVARAIDLAGISEVMGTVAGDDTILVATPGEDAADRIAREWSSEREVMR